VATANSARRCSIIASIAAWTVPFASPPPTRVLVFDGVFLQRPEHRPGPELLHECRLLGGCKTGDAGEQELLASCYRRSIELAAAHGVGTIAFPCIGTGVYGYPIEEAATIAVATVRDQIARAASIGEVVFCCFSAGDLEVYRRLLADVSA
jgi:hypothetical protein